MIQEGFFVWHWLTSITQLRDFLSSNHWQVPSFLRAFLLPQQLSFSCFSVSKIYYSRPYIKDAVWANQLSSGDWKKSSGEKVIVFSYFNRNMKCESLLYYTIKIWYCVWLQRVFKMCDIYSFSKQGSTHSNIFKTIITKIFQKS